MSAQTYSEIYNLPNNFQEGNTDTPIKAVDLNRYAKTAEAQWPVALLAMGNGVAQDFGNELLVSAGSGLSVNVASGLAIVGLGNSVVGVQNQGTYNLGSLPNNRGAMNPIYLFIKASDGSVVTSSTETRLPLFRHETTPTLAGAVLLATITTGASSVLSVTPNPLRFIKGGGTGVPDGTNDGDVPKWNVGTEAYEAAPIAVTRPQTLHLTSTVPLTLKNALTGATTLLTPGDNESDLQTAVASLIPGATSSDIDLDNVTSTTATPGGFNFAGGGIAAANGLYVTDGTSGGFPKYRLDAHRYITSNGTNYQGYDDSLGLPASTYTGPSSNTMLGSWSSPSSPNPTVTEVEEEVGELELDISFIGSLLGRNFNISADVPGALEVTQWGNKGPNAAGDATMAEALEWASRSAAAAVRSVAQTDHGLAESDAIYCTGDDTYAKVVTSGTPTEAQLRCVGFVEEVSDDDHFTFRPIGPVAVIDRDKYPFSSGQDFYLSAEGGSTARPTTPGIRYMNVLRGLNETTGEAILLNESVQKVPDYMFPYIILPSTSHNWKVMVNDEGDLITELMP